MKMSVEKDCKNKDVRQSKYEIPLEMNFEGNKIPSDWNHQKRKGKNLLKFLEVFLFLLSKILWNLQVGK